MRSTEYNIDSRKKPTKKSKPEKKKHSSSEDEEEETIDRYSYQNDSFNGGDKKIGSIKPNYYESARQSNHESNWFFHYIEEWVNYFYGILGYITQPSSENTYISNKDIFPKEKFDALNKYRAHISVTYDSNNKEHEKLLMHLWNVTFPKKKLNSRISQQWKDLGFQGTDPQTDFRGAGVFGLWNLLYFADRYYSQYARFFKKTLKTKGSYPFAIAGLNVTMMIFEIIGWGIPTKSKVNIEVRKKLVNMIIESERKWDRSVWWDVLENDRGDDDDHDDHDDEIVKKKEEKKKVKEETLLDFDWGDDSSKKKEVKVEKKEVKKKEVKKKKNIKKKTFVFEELYCLAFRIMNEEWYSMNATYFQFPDVMKVTRQRVERILEESIFEKKDLISYNKNGKT